MVGPQRVGGQTQKKWGPKGGAPKGGGPKFRAFFFPLTPPFRCFCVSFGLFRGILVVFEAPGRSNVPGCRVRAPAAGLVGPPGFHTTTREWYLPTQQHTDTHTTHHNTRPGLRWPGLSWSGLSWPGRSRTGLSRTGPK